MKNLNLFGMFLALFIVSTLPAHAQGGDALTKFVSAFDYAARLEMKTNSRELVEWLINDKAVLVDIRFAEEQALWGMNFALNIPLAELPKRLKELPKDKIIVTACPHNDRANIAMVYLTAQGYKAKYLTDGLGGLAEFLRGDVAKAFYEAMNKKP